MRRLVQDRCALFCLELGQNVAALFFVSREEPLEAEPSGGHPGYRQGGDQRAGAGKGSHADALLDAFGGDDLAGVRNRWRSGVRHQGDRRAAAKLGDQLVSFVVLVVLVVACERLLDLKVVEKAQGIARVLGGDEIDLTEGAKDALGDVAEVADRGGAEVEGAGGEGSWS